MRECIDCPDSVHRIRVFVADCLNIPVQDLITEKVLVYACDSVYRMNITFGAGCEEKIQYIPQSCDSLKISIVSAGRTQLESEIIYLNQGIGDQKDVIIAVKLDNIISRWWFYTVNGIVPLNRRRFTLCVYDCKYKEVECYLFRRYKK
ncbi:MAG: hypothetical protein GXO48_06390 [Chlorobi bacterium]|nr:hypothetical protein [Chlorobiota bacterium]